jgi:hypothetical protein
MSVWPSGFQPALWFACIKKIKKKNYFLILFGKFDKNGIGKVMLVLSDEVWIANK